MDSVLLFLATAPLWVVLAISAAAVLFALTAVFKWGGMFTPVTEEEMAERRRQLAESVEAWVAEKKVEAASEGRRCVGLAFDDDDFADLHQHYHGCPPGDDPAPIVIGGVRLVPRSSLL